MLAATVWLVVLVVSAVAGQSLSGDSEEVGTGAQSHPLAVYGRPQSAAYLQPRVAPELEAYHPGPAVNPMTGAVSRRAKRFISTEDAVKAGIRIMGAALKIYETAKPHVLALYHALKPPIDELWAVAKPIVNALRGVFKRMIDELLRTLNFQNISKILTAMQSIKPIPPRRARGKRSLVESLNEILTALGEIDY